MAPPMAGLISASAISKSGEEQSLKRYYKTKIEDMQVMVIPFSVEALRGRMCRCNNHKMFQ